MATIFEALYKSDEEGQNLVIDLSNLNSGIYDERYKNHLFCTTDNCNAKLSFVFKENNRSYFRTWRNSPHVEDCIYFFEKSKERSGNRQNGYQDGIASKDQTLRSLKEAYAYEIMSDIEKENLKDKQRTARTRRNRERVRKGTNERPAQRIVADPDKINEDTVQRTGRLYKRDVDALKEADLGENRTVTGNIKDIKYSDSYAEIKVEKNNKEIMVKFERAFFSINPQYEGMFHHIERFIKENENVKLNVKGEIRKNKNDEFEVAVFEGFAFLIQGRSLIAIAGEHALKDNEK